MTDKHAQDIEQDIEQQEQRRAADVKRGVKNVETPEVKKLKEAFITVSNTKSGQLVLRYIMQTCGFKDSNVMYNKQTGEIAVNTTVARAAQQAVWIGVRPLIPVSKRNEIEGDK